MINVVSHRQQHVTGSGDMSLLTLRFNSATTLIDSTNCSNGKNFPDYNQVQKQQAKANISFCLHGRRHKYM